MLWPQRSLKLEKLEHVETDPLVFVPNEVTMGEAEPANQMGAYRGGAAEQNVTRYICDLCPVTSLS